MAIARAKGRLKGKTPKLSRTQRTVLLKLHGGGEHSIAELAELYSVSRATPPPVNGSGRSDPRGPLGRGARRAVTPGEQPGSRWGVVQQRRDA
jgi:hypothetical protein